jgi:CspA family cold shock protein
MSSQTRVPVCQRCGRGFILTSTYRDLLARRQANAIVPTLCPTCFVTIGPPPKVRGSVKWFNPDKRYGFIIAGPDEEVFFHQEQLLGSNRVQSGQQVRFHIRYSAKGPEALNVELLEG